MADVTTAAARNVEQPYYYDEYDELDSVSDDYEKRDVFRWVLWKIIQPTLWSVGLLCNLIVVGVVIATPSLRRYYPRAVHVVWMAALDNCHLLLVEVHHVADVDVSSCAALRAWVYVVHLVHFTPLLLALLVCQPYLAHVFPRLGRKLSSMFWTNIQVIVLLALFAVFGLGPALNLHSVNSGPCTIRDFGLHKRLLQATIFLCSGVPMLAMATTAGATFLARRWRSTAPQGASKLVDPARESTPQYERLEEAGRGWQHTTNSAVTAKAPATAVDGHATLLWAALIYSTILLGPSLVLHNLNLYHPELFKWSQAMLIFRDIVFFMTHFFRKFKIFVYLAGWRDFRMSCATVLARLRSRFLRCGGRGHRSSLPSEMTPSDGGTEMDC